MDKIEDLIFDISNATDIVSSVSSWYYPDYKYVVNDVIGFGNQGYLIDFNYKFICLLELMCLGSGIPQTDLTDEEFSNFTSFFLFSPWGSKWQENFYPEKPPVCGQPLSKLLVILFSGHTSSSR